jgi:hypothetical protein
MMTRTLTTSTESALLERRDVAPGGGTVRPNDSRSPVREPEAVRDSWRLVAQRTRFVCRLIDCVRRRSMRWTVWARCACTVGPTHFSRSARAHPTTPRCSTRAPCSVGANKDTFAKLGGYSVALFVLSLGPFFAITRTPLGGEVPVRPAGGRRARPCSTYVRVASADPLRRPGGNHAQRERHDRVSGEACILTPPPCALRTPPPFRTACLLQRGRRGRYCQSRHCGVRLQRLS